MIPSGDAALGAAAVVFLASLAFAILARRKPAVSSVRSLVAGIAPTPPAAPARHPVLAASDWLRDERERLAAERFVSEAVEAGVAEAVGRLRETFGPKAPSVADAGRPASASAPGASSA